MTVTPFLVRAARYGAIVALIVAVVGGVVGLLTAGTPGLVAALIAAALTAVFLGLTVLSVIVAGRVTGGDATNPVFYAVIMGAWLLKLVVFLVVFVLLRGAAILDPVVFFVCVIVAVLGSLGGDVLAFQRSRIPYTDSKLPGEAPGESPTGSAAG